MKCNHKRREQEEKYEPWDTATMNINTATSRFWIEWCNYCHTYRCWWYVVWIPLSLDTVKPLRTDPFAVNWDGCTILRHQPSLTINHDWAQISSTKMMVVSVSGLHRSSSWQSSWADTMKFMIDCTNSTAIRKRYYQPNNLSENA